MFKKKQQQLDFLIKKKKKLTSFKSEIFYPVGAVLKKL